MLRNYLTVSFRNIVRYKGYSLVNILGLASALACCTFIALYVVHEHSYDRYHRNSDRLFRVTLRIENSAGATGYAINVPPLAPALKREIPEVEESARVFPFDQTRLVRRGNVAFYEEGFCYADPELLSVLTYEFEEGSSQTALVGPESIVIPRRLAEKYFPRESALGKRLTVNGKDRTVTGVVRDAPPNTHLPYDMFTPMADLRDPPWMADWTWPGMITYVRLRSGADRDDVEQKMRSLLAQHYVGNPRADGQSFHFFLQPIRDIYLDSPLEYEFGPSGNAAYLRLFTAIGIAVLLLACFNFINLATARGALRIKEVGIRKVVGASRRKLLGQFMVEAAVVSLLASAAAYGLVLMGRGVFADISGIVVPTSASMSIGILSGSACLAALTALLAGFYPALVLSSKQPGSLGSGSETGRGGVLLRRALVVGQFAATMVMGIGALVINQQLQFMQRKNLGFQKEQKLVIPVHQRLPREMGFDAIRSAFLRQSGIKAVTASANVPGRGAGSLQTRPAGESDSQHRMMYYYFCDEEFVPAYGLRLAAGRNFDPAMSTDASDACLINESAVAAFGWRGASEAIGKSIETGLEGRLKHVIGVVADFHYRGLQYEIEPLIIELDRSQFEYITLTVSTGNLDRTLDSVRAAWQQVLPGRPFDWFFLDESFAQLYRSEERVGKLVSVFTGLALAITCLGLVGFTAFSATRRTKEIGIRKTLGAGVPSVLFLLHRETCLCLLLGNLTAWPVAFYAASHWLQAFAYRTPLGVAPFALAAMLTFLVAVCAVSVPSARAALANPVESLRHE
ncbi:MAG: ABC transporter permease [Acidobacteriota bacterium]